jgi:hypothetical protein
MIEIAPAERGAINAKRGVRPQGQNVINVLFNQFLHMGEREDAQIRAPLHEVPDQPRNDQRLAGSRRHRDQWMTATVVPIRIESVERRALIWSEFKHQPATRRPRKPPLG